MAPAEAATRHVTFICCGRGRGPALWLLPDGAAPSGKKGITGAPMDWNTLSAEDAARLILDHRERGAFEASWIDSVIIAEKPRLSTYIEDMKQAISESGIPSGVINIKAKTNEGMGFVGKGAGIAAYAVCLLKRIE